MTLYEIDARIRDFNFEIDPDTGEFLNADALDALQMERSSKLENIACYYKNISADAKAIKDEETALKKRREALERKADWLKRYLSTSLDGQKFATARAAISFRKSQSVRVDNVELAISALEGMGHTDALRYKSPEIDKSKVKQILINGEQIPGVQIVESLSATIK
ncbi:MAG: siphovirus Gp157 family protein [Abditibacteriota bacterium]|nr:siphovirus Gp157 family protein [Abditibacteriota bacterium]